MHRRLVDQVAVLRLAVIAEAFAVVADDHDRVRPGRALLERRDESAELLVHRGHLAVIRRRGVPRPVGLGRDVRRVRVEVMHPREHRLRRRRLPGRNRTIGRLTGRAFHRARRQHVVVGTEPAREAEASRQHERRHERRRRVAGRCEPLGGDGVSGGQRARVLVQPVSGRVQPGEHRRVRRQCLWRRRIRLHETSPARRDRGERRGLDASRARPDRVGAGGIERDEEDRRTRRGRPWPRGRGITASARGDAQAQRRHHEGHPRHCAHAVASLRPEENSHPANYRSLACPHPQHAGCRSRLPPPARARQAAVTPQPRRAPRARARRVRCP